MITILAVGKIKEKYMSDLINDYQKRITKYHKINIIELEDESNKMNEELVKNKESKKIIEHLNSSSYNILLELKGKMLDSIEFAKKMQNIFTYENSNITFIIGGSYGVNDELKSLVDYKLCFSKMTFPHQLMRGILLEQIYRSFKILNNENYHK